MGTFLSLVGLFICYWFDKYLLLRRYVVPFYLDKRLANTMMSMLPKYTVYTYLYIKKKIGGRFISMSIYMIFILEYKLRNSRESI